MQKNNFALLILMCCSVLNLSAQISLQTEYIGKSAYKDFDNKKNGGHGGAAVYSGSAQLPLKFKPTDDGRMYAWGMSLNSSFTSLSNNDKMIGLSPDKIFNNRIGIMHVRPIWKRWSLMTTVGAGIYASHTNIGKTSFNEVLFDGAAVFVWHLRSNLDIGFGIAINSSFGYPMGFPAFYIQWNTTGRYFVKAQMMDGMSVAAGRHFKDWFSLSLVYDVNGSVAMQKIDGKKMMFPHMYMTSSLQPEFRIGNKITIPVRAGVSFQRTAYYEERTLRAFFKSYSREYDPYFQPSLYLSAGIDINF